MPAIDMQQFLQDAKKLKNIFVKENADQDLIDSCTELIHDATEPLMLMVMGEYSTGKSTFINALLGQEVAVVNMTPTTSVITKICYGEQEKLFIHYKDGRVEEIDVKYFKQMTSESGDDNHKPHLSISYVERRMPIDTLRNLTIIDSPGLNALIASHARATNSFIGKADVVFWIFSADQPISQSAYEAMGRLDSRLKPVAIMNKMDGLDPEEDDPEEFLEENRSKIGDRIKMLFGLSAKMAFEAVTSQNEELEEASGLPAIRDFIKNEVIPNQEEYKRNTLFDDLSDMTQNLYDTQQPILKVLEGLQDEDYASYMQEKEHLVHVRNQFLSTIDPFYRYIMSHTAHNSTEKIFQALLYRSGYLGEANMDKAMELLEEAAMLKDVKAQLLLSVALLKKGDEKKAFYWAEQAAALGNADAQYLLGRMYEDGLGTEKNAEKSFNLYRKAANQGCAIAMTALAAHYNEPGDDQDEKKTRQWLEQAAIAGDDEAMYYWSLQLLRVPLQFKEALKWLRLAARKGSLNAQAKLSDILLESNKPEEQAEGLKLVRAAALRGSAAAQDSLALLYAEGADGIEKNLQKADYWFTQAIAQNSDEARVDKADFLANQPDDQQHVEEIMQLLETAAGHGYAKALFYLGMVYTDRGDKYVTHDDKKALHYLEEAAKLGHARAMVEAADLLDEDDAEASQKKAFSYLQQAADLGEADAYYTLGNKYFFGKGVPEDKEKGVFYYKQAARNGDMLARCCLADCYWDGEGIKKDPAKAFSLYQKVLAADPELKNMAAFGIARCYETGRGVQADPDQAFKYYTQAAEAGSGFSMNWLGNRAWGAKDYTQAAAWYKKAAEAGFGQGMENLAVLYRDGKGLEQNQQQAYHWFAKAAKLGSITAMNQAGLTAASERTAFRWYKKAAGAGHAWGMFNLGGMYKDGRGTDQDWEKAYEWFVKAAENGIEAAYNQAGITAKDEEDKIRWYEKAGEAGNDWGYYNLGDVYKGKRDYRKALENYKKAINMEGESCGDALFNAGKLYADGDFGSKSDKDLHTALSYLGNAKKQGNKDAERVIQSVRQELKEREASRRFDAHVREVKTISPKVNPQWLSDYELFAGKNDTQSLYALGCFYADGKLLQKDLPLAEDCLKKASEAGHPQAAEKLKEIQPALLLLHLKNGLRNLLSFLCGSTGDLIMMAICFGLAYYLFYDPTYIPQPFSDPNFKTPLLDLWLMICAVIMRPINFTVTLAVLLYTLYTTAANDLVQVMLAFVPIAILCNRNKPGIIKYFVLISVWIVADGIISVLYLDHYATLARYMSIDSFESLFYNSAVVAIVGGFLNKKRVNG